MDQSLIYKKEVFNYYNTTVVINTTGWVMHGEGEVILEGDFAEEFLYLSDDTEITNLRCIKTGEVLKTHVKNS